MAKDSQSTIAIRLFIKVGGIEILIESFNEVAKGCEFNLPGKPPMVAECTSPQVCTRGVREYCDWASCPYGKEV